MVVRSKDISAIYELLYNPNFIPRRSPDAHVESITIEGTPTNVLIKESDHESYEVDDDTSQVWKLLDGNRTVKEVVEAAAKLEAPVGERDVKDVIVSLAQEGVIETTEAEVEKKRVEIESAFQINIHLLENSSESLAGLFRFTRKLIRRWELYAALAISFAGAVLFSGTFVQIFSNPTYMSIAGSTLLGYFFYQMFILLPVYGVHEVAHGAVCDYYGAKPREIGTGLYYLAPFFYCDTSDAWRLPKRARIMISLAGPLSELTITACFVFASFFVPPGFGKDILLVGSFLGFYGTLINLSPIIETDGYYILSDVLNMPNLRDETFGFIKKGVLGALGRPVSKVRRSSKTKRIFYVYALIMFGWLAFFGYTTLHLFAIYGADAYSSAILLGSTALGLKAFSFVGVGVSVATIVYFTLLMGGFAVMGSVAYKRVHVGGARLETIHDKRVSVFMPVPSSIGRDRASALVKKSRAVARRYSRSFSVTLEPPFCVASLKLGKVDETLADTRSSMARVEQSFRSMHGDFISGGAVTEDIMAAKSWMGGDMAAIARQLSGEERRRAQTGAKDFVRRHQGALRTVLLSGFGTVWTLELAPEDFRRLRKQIFPALVAEDLGGGSLPADLEAFKKRVVFGADALAKLSSEVEEESAEVFRNPEEHQTTVFMEPVGSKLVFAGRTDRAEGSVVWLGGLFLYQAWLGFINEALGEASMGLKSLRALPSPLTKVNAGKLTREELALLKADFARLEGVQKAVEGCTVKIDSTYESALNFHESLESLVTEQGFDVGLYTPILNANRKRLEGVKEGLGDFAREWGKAYEKIQKASVTASEELAARAQSAKEGKGLRELLGGLATQRPRTTPFEGEVKSIYSAYRLVYDVIAASDVVV